jgi:hypothetical protein
MHTSVLGSRSSCRHKYSPLHLIYTDFQHNILKVAKYFNFITMLHNSMKQKLNCWIRGPHNGNYKNYGVLDCNAV